MTDIEFLGRGGAIGRNGAAQIVAIRMGRVANGVLLRPITTRRRLFNGLMVLPPEPGPLRRIAGSLLRMADELEREGRTP